MSDTEQTEVETPGRPADGVNIVRGEADPRTGDPDNPMNMQPNTVVELAPRCPTCHQYLPNDLVLAIDEETEEPIVKPKPAAQQPAAIPATPEPEEAYEEQQPEQEQEPTEEEPPEEEQQ